MKCFSTKTFSFYFFILSNFFVFAQTNLYTHADSLRGGITDARKWWDLTHYDLHVTFNEKDSSIFGYNIISYKTLDYYPLMQLDLMQPMIIDSVVQDKQQCKFIRDGSAYFISTIKTSISNNTTSLFVYFHGKPHVAVFPPWDGGIIWSKDKNNNPWISVACQGMASSVWFPNKDHQYDEVDSASVYFTASSNLVTVSNGKFKSIKTNSNQTKTYSWVVKNPINNYNIIPYIGKYVNFKDTFYGKAGVLDLDFWVLEGNIEKAKQQFKQVKPMLRCFEDWFGKYPFYEDGYKLVEAPFLGMEHQSAIAYGNKFKNGYLGKDLSLTGWGLNWDFIIVHESGHEWFGNSITAKDVADNWIHEGFTAYSENLFVESLYGKKAGAEYVIGTRNAILNDRSIITNYNVNKDGSGDMYYKAANMLHTIRQLINNDELWKKMLQGLNQNFWHQTVSTKQIEDYLITFLNYDLQKIFDQYLRTKQIPVLEYSYSNKILKFRWSNCILGFNLPIRLISKNNIWIYPSEEWKTISLDDKNFIIDPNFYINSKRMN